jgi:hypothetical protein
MAKPVANYAKENPALIRELMREKFPLLPANYHNKPSPIHISNNFVGIAIGEGNLKTELRNWITDSELIEKFLKSSDDHIEIDSQILQDVLKTIYDTDGNVYKSMASPFPLTPLFLGRDPNDNGYAQGLWLSLGKENRSSIHELLLDFYSTEDEDSSLGNLIAAFTEGSSFKPSIPIELKSSSSVGTNVGIIILESLKRKQNQPIHIRMEILRQLSTLLSAFVVIGMFFDSCAEDRGLGKDASPMDVLGTVIYTGDIGSRGSIEQRLSTLAVISLRDTIERAHSGISKSFKAMVSESRKANSSQAWDDFCKTFATKYLSADSAQEFIKYLKYFGETGIDSLTSSMLPITYLRSAIRSLGTKAGLVWPSRRDQPRLALDSNFLTSLVSFVGESDMTVGEFVASVNEKLGLIMGYSGVTETQILHLESLAGRKLEVRDLLVKAEKLLTTRLVSAGLARQFSDGTSSLIGGNI